MTMVEHHLSVQRTARYYTLGDTAAAPRSIWFVCHGYGQLAERFLRDFEPLDDGATLVIAPEALSRTYIRGSHGLVGASWMTREDRENEIADYVRYLDALLERTLAIDGAADAALTVFGFSQGTATAARWVALGAVRPQRLLLWGSLLPPDPSIDEARERYAAAEITFVVGSDDDVVDRNALAAQGAALAAAGVRHRVREYAGGHRLDRETLLALADGA